MYEGVSLTPLTPLASTPTSRTDGNGALGRPPGQEMRFVELVARAWLEPELAQRYRADARSVLVEFGVELAPGELPPALPESPVCELTIEELSRPSTAHAQLCFCLDSPAPEPDRTAVRAGNQTVVR
ncbi:MULTISPECIES: TIGR04351 family putative TOMM peptide [Streptomyces]|uniref:TIGR04351 family putative TOMM peptide n=2 Tax=Streptomyces TaxID=1883 RepID=A0ABV9IS09_9ACTN